MPTSPTPPTLPPEPLLTLKQVAMRLGVSVRTVETLVAEGKLVPLRVRPKLRRFDPAAVEAYLRLTARGRYQP